VKDYIKQWEKVKASLLKIGATTEFGPWKCFGIFLYQLPLIFNLAEVI